MYNIMSAFYIYSFNFKTVGYNGISYSWIFLIYQMTVNMLFKKFPTGPSLSKTVVKKMQKYHNLF